MRPRNVKNAPNGCIGIATLEGGSIFDYGVGELLFGRSVPPPFKFKFILQIPNIYNQLI